MQRRFGVLVSNATERVEPYATKILSCHSNHSLFDTETKRKPGVLHNLNIWLGNLSAFWMVLCWVWNGLRKYQPFVPRFKTGTSRVKYQYCSYASRCSEKLRNKRIKSDKYSMLWYVNWFKFQNTLDVKLK